MTPTINQRLNVTALSRKTCYPEHSAYHSSLIIISVDQIWEIANGKIKNMDHNKTKRPNSIHFVAASHSRFTFALEKANVPAKQSRTLPINAIKPSTQSQYIGAKRWKPFNGVKPHPARHYRAPRLPIRCSGANSRTPFTPDHAILARSQDAATLSNTNHQHLARSTSFWYFLQATRKNRAGCWHASSRCRSQPTARPTWAKLCITPREEW